MESLFSELFFMVIQDEMKSNSAFLTLDWNRDKKFPTSSEYSKYYLAVKYYSKISGNKISTFEKSNAYDYYPITTC
ncbi:MAG: hypothetical protein PUK41_07755 [Campylobacter hominis]|uniref:hypothetical protein n=1 Tax=Campylobacter TaxID=194 RepID=UPI0023F4D5BB|nr:MULTISPECIES: hypothetical protein [Campylobacter]MCI6641289.1 hypothetical protein [Campylobacter sp.]MDD7423228.1 hypothetical protein [Campylobacter hominis]